MSDAESYAANKREPSKKVGAMGQLLPFVKPYKWLVFLALLSLSFTALISLIMPLAVRQVIDNFDVSENNLLDRYFGMAFFIAALLAV